jgi:hypothetical protein
VMIISRHALSQILPSQLDSHLPLDVWSAVNIFEKIVSKS